MSEPTLKSLRDRAAELEISGRSTMDAGELVDAIAAAEAAKAQQVANATVDVPAVPELPDPAVVGRPALADVATERAVRRAATRRVLDAAQED